jgi:hypothetical protein
MPLEVKGKKVDFALLLAPSVTLIAFIFNLLVLLDPIYYQDAQFVFLVKSSSDADGPTLLLGLLGSCSRPNGEGHLDCTGLSFAPTYNATVLPDGPARKLLSPPPSSAGAPIFIILSLVSAIVFVIAFLAMARKWCTRPDIKILTGLSGVFTCLCTVFAFLIASLWFQKVAEDFNEVNGDDAPLVAATENAITMLWVSIGLDGLAVVLSLTKHVGKKEERQAMA